MGTPKIPTFESLLAKHFGFVRCALWQRHGVPWSDLSDLLALLDGLSPDRRAVVVAHVLENVPMAEVAERLQIPVATAWNRHRCAMADLHAAARKRGRA